MCQCTRVIFQTVTNLTFRSKRQHTVRFATDDDFLHNYSKGEHIARRRAARDRRRACFTKYLRSSPQQI